MKRLLTIGAFVLIAVMTALLWRWIIAYPSGSVIVIGATPSVAVTPTAPRIWNCNAGDIYQCSSFAHREEMMDYWRACPGDPSRLDGDRDGRPCEPKPRR